MERKTTALKHLLLLTFMFIGFVTNAQIVYVDQNATGTGDGASWANAMTDLQSAIDAAATVATPSNPIQVWVKSDTYYPTVGTDRTISFEMKNDVAIYGGFFGSETSLNQRDWKNNKTILSGEIGDLTTLGDNTHCIINNNFSTASPLLRTAVIDGFTITKGYLTLASLSGGAGIRNVNASPTIRNVEFDTNNATISGNNSTSGGAILNIGESHPYIESCIFDNNYGRSAGGAISFGTYWTSVSSNPSHNVESVIVNCLFRGNLTRQNGSAVYINNYLVNIYNNTFTENENIFDNTFVFGRPVYYIFDKTIANPSLTNNIIWNNLPNGVWTEYQGGTTVLTQTTNLLADPSFIDSVLKNFNLDPCSSPATNEGTTIGSLPTTDLNGMPRVFDSNVDIGAYENQVLPIAINSIGLGSPSCNGASDGEINVAASGGSGAPIHYSIDGVNFSSNMVFSGISAGDYTITIMDTGTGCTLSENRTVTEPSNFSVTIGSVDITCNGDANGEISGTVSGASGPYIVSLNGSSATGQFTTDFIIENLTADTYNLTIADGNGCLYTHPSSITVSEPDVITGSFAVTDALCNGEASGEVTITASGGNAPLYYTLGGLSGNYSSSPVFDNLAAGNYVATVVDSKLCFLDIPFTIGEPSAISISSVTAIDPSCDANSDGSISVSATGGTPSLFYSIDGVNFVASTTFNDLAAGTYTITVEDENGCRAEVTETLENQINLTLSITSVTNVSCNGEADGGFEVSLLGGTAVRYFINGMAPQTSGVFSNISAGSYSVTGQDTNGCTAIVTVDVNEPDELELSIAQTGRSFTLSATGGTPPYEYSNNGTTFQSTGSFSTLDPGAYIFIVRDANGCTTESNEFDVILGITNLDVLIYPNPVSDVLKVEGVAFDELSIYNLMGQELLLSKSSSVSVKKLAKGTYILCLFKDQIEIHNQKLIVN